MASLFICSDLAQATRLKIALTSPHIHVVIEEGCDPFTAEAVWSDALYKSCQVALTLGQCVISHHGRLLSGGLTREEETMLHVQQKNIIARMQGIDVYYVE